MKMFISNLFKNTTVDFRIRLASHRSIFPVTQMALLIEIWLETFVMTKVNVIFYQLVNVTLAQKQNQKLNQN